MFFAEFARLPALPPVPVYVGELLQASKCLLFEIARQKIKKADREIAPEYLEVDAELKAPDSRLLLKSKGFKISLNPDFYILK